jgi:hypothetical protein
LIYALKKILNDLKKIDILFYNPSLTAGVFFIKLKKSMWKTHLKTSSSYRAVVDHHVDRLDVEAQ